MTCLAFQRMRSIAVSATPRVVVALALVTVASIGLQGCSSSGSSSSEPTDEAVITPPNPAADLVVDSASVSDSSPDAGASFTLRATVRNRGDAGSAATTLRYYRSSDATISASDTQVGTDAVGGLAASSASAESTSLTAPAAAGTYYYGACVDPVGDESDTDNNCSGAARVDVSSPDGGASDSYCRAGDTLQPGQSCTIYTTSFTFDVESSGRGCLRAGGILSCSGSSQNLRSTTLNGVRITFVARRNANDSWTIDEIDPSPDGSGGGTDDHGDTFADATRVAIPSTTAGELEEGGDRDYFRAEVAQAGTYSVETTGSTDTYGTGFDGNRSLLEWNDDGGSGSNFKIEGDLEPGTYFVEVRGFSSSTTGTYEVVVRPVSGGGGGDSYCRDGQRIDNGTECDIYSTDAVLGIDSSGRFCTRSVPGWGDGCTRGSVGGRWLIDRRGGIRIYATRTTSAYWTIDDVEPEPAD